MVQIASKKPHIILETRNQYYFAWREVMGFMEL